MRASWCRRSRGRAAHRADPPRRTARSPSRIASSFLSEIRERQAAHGVELRSSGVERSCSSNGLSSLLRIFSRARGVAGQRRLAWACTIAHAAGSSERPRRSGARSNSRCSAVENPREIVVRGDVGDERRRLDRLAAAARGPHAPRRGRPRRDRSWPAIRGSGSTAQAEDALRLLSASRAAGDAGECPRTAPLGVRGSRRTACRRCSSASSHRPETDLDEREGRGGDPVGPERSSAPSRSSGCARARIPGTSR